MSDTLYCTFCGKSQHDVPKLIMGPGNVGICNECISLCAHIVVAEMEGQTLYISKLPPVDSKAIIKEIVREIREETAQGIAARSDETPQEVRPEGQEPGGEAMRPTTGPETIT
jgi:hypothetical protein